MFGSFIALDASQHFNAINLREFQIKEDYLWTMLDFPVRECACRENEIQSLGSIFNDEHFACEVLFLKGSQRQLNIVWVVLHQKDLHVFKCRHRSTFRFKAVICSVRANRLQDHQRPCKTYRTRRVSQHSYLLLVCSTRLCPSLLPTTSERQQEWTCCGRPFACDAAPRCHRS